MRLASLLLLFTSTFYVSNLYAYKQDTHQLMSERAVEMSVLDSDPIFLKRLGFSTTGIEGGLFPSSENEYLTIKDLVREGSYLEDVGIRAFNHFYDPQNEIPLTVFGFELGETSPDWSLIKAAGSGYSIVDAYDSFYRALETAPITINESYAHWGKTFQSIGHLIHHIQDMSQPQHTRNDDHCDSAFCKPLGKYELSGYEVLSSNEKYSLNLSGYPIVNYPSARLYWDDVLKENGLSVLSSYNFVTEGTNFRVSQGTVITHPDYPSPTFDSSLAKDVDISELIPGSGLSGIVRYYGNNFVDNYTGEVVKNDFLTSESIFYTNLGANTADVFVVDNRVYRSMQDILVPRAVSYSAGFIDYFFRVKLELISYIDDGTRITFTLQNKSQNGDIKYGLKAGGAPGASNSVVAMYVNDLGLADSITLTEDVPYDGTFQLEVMKYRLSDPDNLPMSFAFKGGTYVESQPNIIEMGVGGIYFHSKPIMFSVSERFNIEGVGERTTDGNRYDVFRPVYGYTETESLSSNLGLIGEGSLLRNLSYSGSSSFTRVTDSSDPWRRYYTITKSWSGYPTTSEYRAGIVKQEVSPNGTNGSFFESLKFNSVTGNYYCEGYVADCETNEDGPPEPYPFVERDMLDSFKLKHPAIGTIYSREYLSEIGIDIPESFGGLKVVHSFVGFSGAFPSKYLNESAQHVFLIPANEMAIYDSTIGGVID